jgi:D-sedoheptulose 7-phosphate isomerase
MSFDVIPGFEGFADKFTSILLTQEWSQAQQDFNHSKLILTAGNGGNLAVCDHGAIDIARLTDKQAMAPGSGILASSLINDASHDLWVRNWLSITMRGHSSEFLSKMMLIGVSSSGYSTNICMALDLALEKGMKALLISATKPHISGLYNTIILDVDQYHTSEVLTLALFYQLIHGAGFACPTISDSTARQVVSDYTR